MIERKTFELTTISYHCYFILYVQFIYIHPLNLLYCHSHIVFIQIRCKTKQSTASIKIKNRTTTIEKRIIDQIARKESNRNRMNHAYNILMLFFFVWIKLMFGSWWIFKRRQIFFLPLELFMFYVPIIDTMICKQAKISTK